MAGMMHSSRFVLSADMILIVVTALSIIVSATYMTAVPFCRGDYYVLMLLSLAGMMFMIHANNLVMLVIGLETMSLAVYALIASWPGRARGAESGIKYFITGAVISALLLYGIALIYGYCGSTDFAVIADHLARSGMTPLPIFGMLLVLCAMLFKVAAAPFYMWLPDAYEGAPTPVTGFMAAAVKSASFIALTRLLYGLFRTESLMSSPSGWANIIAWLSVITMTVGNLGALKQKSVKRMLAYSSVAHAGYLLLGVVAVGLVPDAESALLIYLALYSLATIGCFAVIAWISSRYDIAGEYLADFRGLGRRHPLVAFAMSCFLLSLGGFPPLAGFFGKFMLFRAAMEHSGLAVFVVIAVLNSVLSLYYYLQPVIAMYFEDSESHLLANGGGSGGDKHLEPGVLRAAPGALRLVIVALGFATIIASLFPQLGLHFVSGSPLH